MTRIFRFCIGVGAIALALMAAAPSVAQNGNGHGEGQGTNGLPVATSAGANLLLHAQQRDSIVRQLAATTAMGQTMSARAADFRTRLSGDGGMSLQPLLSALASERRRIDELIANARRLEGPAETNALGALLERFDARFPPQFAAPLERIEGDFNRGLAELRIAVEGAARLDNPELGRVASAFVSGLARYQQNVANGLRSLRETAHFPQYVYEMVGAPSFAAMATPAVAQQFADLFRAKLQDIETQSRALIAAHADERGQLLRLATNLSEMVETNLQSLLREKARSEDMMIQQAERNFGHNVNEGSFKWMLVIFGIAFVVLFIVPYLYRDLDATSIPGQILTSNFILQFCTVFILTASIVLLGIGRYIETDQLPVLLAGISGYVLGQLGRNQRASEEAPAK